MTDPAAATTDLLSSEAVVRANAGDYEPLETAGTPVALALPSGATEAYLLAVPRAGARPRGVYDPVADLIATVAAVAALPESPAAQFGPDTEVGTLLGRAQRRPEPATVRALAEAHTAAVAAARAAGVWAQPVATPVSAALAAHLWTQAYARVVDDPDSLNSYRSFSKEVYGETRPPLVTDVLARVGARRKELFVDLGMGLGNVVFQAAAQAQCAAVGIELLERPYMYATRLLPELERRVAAYARTLGRVRLFRGDFLQHPALAALINAVDVVFCNNYVFESETNEALLRLLLSLKNGARVVSFRPFAPVGQRLTEHNADSPAALFAVAKHTYLRTDGVSWAETQMDYYVHTVDRTRLRAAQAAVAATATATAHSAGAKKRPVPDGSGSDPSDDASRRRRVDAA
jgi:hypothetical protein